MSRKPRLLDLFTGVGGAYVGYERAGFRVQGVDIADQPDHPGVWFQDDAIRYLENVLTDWQYGDVDLIHAAPPCQAYTALSSGTNAHLAGTYPRLYEPVKILLNEIWKRHGIPYVIENPAARADVVLCGEMFGLRVLRHRHFELGGWEADQPLHIKHRGLTLGMRHGKLVTEADGGYYYGVYGDGGYKGTVPQWQDAMGIHWTGVRKSIAEAVPPAYTEWVGRQFIKQM